MKYELTKDGKEYNGHPITTLVSIIVLIIVLPIAIIFKTITGKDLPGCKIEFKGEENEI